MALGYLQQIPPSSSDAIASVAFGSVDVGNRTVEKNGLGELTSILAPPLVELNGRQLEHPTL